MKQLIALGFAVFLTGMAYAQPIKVSNAAELNKANSNARPGDTIILRNGKWNNVSIQLNCSGTVDKPILFKAETAGQVILCGQSELKLGGSWIIVDGLLFSGGYSPTNAVIDFRISHEQPANHCRVTNCVVNDFNKPKRLQDDQWVAFYGQHNRLDHCSFFNKKNLGTLLAVFLDDDRCRENFHSIDHNYFGIRPPLASNGGEIMRIGLAEHALFNSNTQVTSNFFEYCDGEAEVISIKSCGNIVSGNVFKECQGSVVLRHGNYNTIKNNIFLGNGKEASGGVRIINRGQWVINNFFYRCRGASFRAPISMMNGIPNSPAERYVQVTDAIVMNNTFIDCAAMSLCEGSDKERTLTPSHVLFAKNTFYNRPDSVLYKAWDDISGILFTENEVSFAGRQQLADGFDRVSFNQNKTTAIQQKQLQVRKASGAAWFTPGHSNLTPVSVACNNAAEIYHALEKQSTPLLIHLTGQTYLFNKPVVISNRVEFIGKPDKEITLQTEKPLPAIFIVKAKGYLRLQHLQISGAKLSAEAFIDTDTSGSPEHYSLFMNQVLLNNFNGCTTLLNARASTLADSIVVQQCRFDHINNGFLLAAEKDDKGYYSAEQIRFTGNQFANGHGMLLDLYRGGKDESTLGPQLLFANNHITNYNTSNQGPLVQLMGVQKTAITGNQFSHCNAAGPLIVYKDIVRAMHYLSHNNFSGCGTVEKNNFVTSE
jgi:poly(beta-D-mannuronate) lyase